MRNRILQRLENKKKSNESVTPYYHETSPFTSRLSNPSLRESTYEDKSNSIYNRIYQARQGGVRKYGEGGQNEHMDLIINSGPEAWTAHQQEEHHAGGDTGDTGSEYGPNSDNPYGPPPEYGAYVGLDPNWNKGGIKGFYGTVNESLKAAAKGKMPWGVYGTGLDKLKDKYTGMAKDWAGKQWEDIKPTGEAVKNIGNSFGNFFGNMFEDGGVRHQEGGMYDQMKQYNMGGVQQLPGGDMTSLGVGGAVQFNGQTHDEGGIMMDSNTEVEDGETMDKVTMAKEGGERDYFFSQHLKEGGVPFSELHKDILNNGGNQEDINMLARMQENKAGRTTSKIGTAKLGGVVNYEDGGEKDYTNISTQGVASEEYYNPEEFGDIAALQHSKTFTLDSGEEITLYGDDHLFEQIESKGTDSWLKDMYDNADPEVMKAAGITSYDQMGSKDSNLKYQKAWNSINPESAIKEDSLFGEQTTRTMYKKPEPEPDTQEDSTTDIDTTTTTTTGSRKDWAGSLLGLGSMIPAVMAFTEKPDYMANQDLQAPGIVKAERISKQHLDRVDFNDQLARNSSDAVAMNKYIETSGGGPANMANKMAAYAKKQQGDRDIKAQETKANIAISNEENVLDNKRKAYNAEAALDASKFNVSAADKADSNNIRNNMYVDEFNRAADASTKDRKLNAVQYGINSLATLYRDKLTRGASDNLALAIDGQRGALNRFFEDQENKKTTNTTTTTVPAKRGGYRSINNLRR
jgi:hypothetical protein